jgi:hypothetical protein
MALFDYGQGALRNYARGLGDLVRGESVQWDQMGTVGQSIGGLLNNYTGNRDQANLEEQWNREDTAMQRQVADAEAAGFNPMQLAGTTGAPTSTASSTQGRSDPVKAALTIAQFDKQLALMDSQIRNVDSSSKLNEAKAQEAAASTGKTEAETQRLTTTFSDFVRQASSMADESASRARSAGLQSDWHEAQSQFYQRSAQAGIRREESSAIMSQLESEQATMERLLWNAWQNGQDQASVTMMIPFQVGNRIEPVAQQVTVDLTGLKYPHQVQLLLDSIQLDSLNRAYKFIGVNAIAGAVSTGLSAVNTGLNVVNTGLNVHEVLD